MRLLWWGRLGRVLAFFRAPAEGGGGREACPLPGAGLSVPHGTASSGLPSKIHSFSVARKGNSDLSFPEILSFLDISFKNLPLVVFSLPHTLSVFFTLLFLQMGSPSFPLMTVSSLPSLAGIWFCGFEAVQ